MGAVLRRASELGVAVEHNAAPERLDLNDRDLRLAKELGCRITINSDSHDARNLGKMEYGIRQLRRAWLGPEDVLNTLEAEGFAGRPAAAGMIRAAKMPNFQCNFRYSCASICRISWPAERLSG